MHERTLINAQLHAKCPHCRQGDIFKFPISKITRFAAMNDECPVCGVSFSPEPGFYFGAMFVSYALSVGLFVVLGLLLYVAYNPSDVVYLIVISVGAVLFTPFSFRYSRVLFLYWFGGYRYQKHS